MTNTNLATYNHNLNINTEETAEIIHIDRKRRRNAQKRRNQCINRLMGSILVMVSSALYITAEVLGVMDCEIIFFLIASGALGIWTAAQNEKIFNI